jgi:DNA-binding YbaB/EbfC family protein
MRGMNDLMRQAQQMHKKMEKVQEELAQKTVEAQAGGGMVTATANGQGDLVGLQIDPSVVDPEDVEMLQDLVLAACKEAQKKGKQMQEDEMGELTGGMNVPGMF